jgi:hypothetical protein
MNRPRLGILVKLSWQLLRLRFSGSSRKQQSNRLLFETFENLGGVYVKFLQILVLDHEFLKGWAGPAEFDVFEAVAYEDIDLPDLLRAELPDYERHFISIDLMPFASGSFAQVYKGQLRDGTRVVLKVLRPSLVKNLRSDLRLLNWIVRLSGLLRKQNAVNMREFYRQFTATVREETNYPREVKNAAWFYDYFYDNDDVVIPRTYAKLSSERIIVQERIDGVSLAEVIQAQGHGQEPSMLVYERTGSNVWTQMETFGTELLVGILTADFVIGDPHPGNIKLLPDDKIGLIDFGIAAAAPANRHAFLNLLREYEKIYAGSFDAGTFTIAALQFFDEELVQALRVAGQLLTPWEPMTLLRKIGEAARRALDDAIASPRASRLLDEKIMMRLFNESINEKNRFGLTINLDAADMLKSAGTCINVIRRVGTYEQNFPVVYNGLKRAIAFAENSNMPESEPAPDPRPEYALEFLSSWLSGIADSDPFLYRQITGTINS